MRPRSFENRTHEDSIAVIGFFIDLTRFSRTHSEKKSPITTPEIVRIINFGKDSSTKKNGMALNRHKVSNSAVFGKFLYRWCGWSEGRLESP